VEGRASVSNIDVGGGVVVAQAMESRCAGGAGRLSGTATLTDVRVAGMPVRGNPAPNTVVSVEGVATVTLDEQIVAADSITVNAVHVQLLTGEVGDVILPQAHCAVSASPLTVAAETPLPVQLALLTMAVLMGAVVVAWRRDPFLLGRSAR
jgi:hypothetical protein